MVWELTVVFIQSLPFDQAHVGPTATRVPSFLTGEAGDYTLTVPAA